MLPRSTKIQPYVVPIRPSLHAQPRTLSLPFPDLGPEVWNPPERTGYALHSPFNDFVGRDPQPHAPLSIHALDHFFPIFLSKKTKNKYFLAKRAYFLLYSLSGKKIIYVDCFA